MTADNGARRKPGPKVRPIAERFWAKVEKTDGCWFWSAFTDHTGYGRFYVGIDVTPRTQAAHRVSWELANGPIPEGLLVDHVCFTHSCVRPSHLRLATNKQNLEHISGPRLNSTAGVRGVSWHRQSGRWRARVKHFGVERDLGLFRTIEEAGAAALSKRNELFTHNTLDRVSA